MASIIRTQATHTFRFRLRSFQDLQIWLDENSAVYDKKTLLKMYKMCTEQPYGFIYINLMEQKKEDMFMFKFEAKLVPAGAQEASMADMMGSAPPPPPLTQSAEHSSTLGPR